MTTAAEIARLRTYAQRLAGPSERTAADAVRWLTAMQGQDLPGAVTSVALRTRSRGRSDVVAALDAGSVVRSWPMRGTLHLTTADDLLWLMPLLAPRAVRASAGRRAGLGLDEDQLERARDVAVSALTGGKRLRRSELFTEWDRAGIATTGQRGVHILRYLAMTGTLVFGPMAGKDQLVVLIAEWIRPHRSLERNEALRELAVRYFRSHGPATGVDLAAWAGLTATDLRTSMALARPHLTNVVVDGVEHLFDESTQLRAGSGAGGEPVLLLPGFDELVLGYRDRRAQLDPEFAERIVPGGNGFFRPTVVDRGRIVGTWTRPPAKPSAAVVATPFTTFSVEAIAAISTHEQNASADG